MVKWKWCFNAICLFSLTFLIIGCTSFEVDHSKPVLLDCNQRIAVFPFTNATETPQADERAQTIAANLLRTRGVRNIVVYPMKQMRVSLIPGLRRPVPRPMLLDWARSRGINFALVGYVTEWNYKVGLDGEPAIGVTLELINTNTEQVIWSSVGSKSGGSRTALTSVAQELMDSMLESIHFPNRISFLNRIF